MSPEAIVVMMGKRIFSSFATGRRESIRMARSAFVVNIFITGGWMRGTRDM